MQTFQELLNRLKETKAYVNDPANNVILTREQVGESISANFEDAVEAYQNKNLQAALSFDTAVLDFLKQHSKEKDNDVIFKLQYFLNKDLPFSYKTYAYRSLGELGEAVASKKLDQDEAVEILKAGLISNFIEAKTFVEIGERNWTLIKVAELQVKTNPQVAVYLLAYVLGKDKTYTFDNTAFSTLEDFYIYLCGRQRFESFAETFETDDRFNAWLLYFGHQKEIQAWHQAVADTEALEAKLPKPKIVKPEPKKVEAKKEVKAKEVKTKEVAVKPAAPIKKAPVKKEPKAKPIKKVIQPAYLIERDHWLNSAVVSLEDKKVIRAMDEDNTKAAFGSVLEFGTAGLRGTMTPGINRMNIFTLRKAALAYAQYVLKYVKFAKLKGLVIAYDNRHHSQEFAKETANVFISLGIKTFLFKHIAPTPELSFAIRKQQAAGGVVITASHNPKQYNGFKVYDAQGGQLVPAEISKLQVFYNAIQDPLALKIDTKGKLKYLHYYDKAMDVAYFEAALKVSLDKKLKPKQLKVIYTSEHGTGYRGVEYVCHKLGYQLIEVKEQIKEDPDFSKTSSPNPEEHAAYEKALLLAKQQPADLIIATDPDADRIGIVVFDKKEPVYLTGNQTGALLIDYLIRTKKRLNKLPKQSVLFDTIVTSRLGATIAKHYHVKVVSTLTGFKYIGEQIAKLKDKKQFLFGYEESYGYVLAPTTRDKDALQATVAILEMANYYKSQGKTLLQALATLYKDYGYHLEETNSVYYNGSNGQAQMQALMARIRKNPPQTFAKFKVLTLEDYLTRKSYHGKKVSAIKLPQSDVLRFLLEDGSFVAVRPSGTEPKCKFYYNIVAVDAKEAQKKLQLFKAVIAKLTK